jgi:predicted metal-dependent HD superfamily phosphohydrolase
MTQSELIAKAEGINTEHEVDLLKLAAAYHDSGFLFTYKNHEEKSCEILKNDLAGKLNKQDIEIVCGLIMATRIPQSPKTHLEKIICDADLDYLGRSDFEPISNNLYKEFIVYGVIKEKDNWNEIQIKFLETHNYFTSSSFLKRNTKKQEHLLLLKSGSSRPS